MRDPVKIQAYRQSAIQCCALLLFFAIAWILISFDIAYSFALGGLITVFSSLVFFAISLRHRTSREAGCMVASVFVAECFKFLSMGLMFFAILKWLPVHVLAVLAGFVGTQLLAMLLPILQRTTVREVSHG